MNKPLACNGISTYTFYFNIIFVILLSINNTFIIKSFGIHIIPFFILSQYLSWYKLLLYKCNFDWKTIHYIFIDFISHWIIPILFIRFINSSDFKNIPVELNGVLLGFLTILLYIHNHDIERVYNISAKKLFIPYISLFLGSFYIINQ